MQACSSSETFYMLIFLIGMLIIPDIHIAHDLLLHFIHVSLQISSLQKGLPWSLKVKRLLPPIHWSLAPYFTLFHSYLLVSNIMLYIYLFMTFCSIKMQVS